MIFKYTEDMSMNALMKNRNLASKWPILIILFLVLIVYANIINGDFLFWDDNQNILENPFLSFSMIHNFFTAPFLGMYIPISYSVWTILSELFGNEPYVFHAFNILLHILNVYLVYSIGKKTTVIKSHFWLLIGTAIFALHPLQVETVAWISGGRDLLAAFFALLSIYLAFSSNKLVSIVVSSFCFLIGALCKISIAPVALIFLFLYKLGREKKSNVLIINGLIYIALLIPLALLTFNTQSHFININSQPSLPQRFIIMLDTFGFYIQSFFYPFHSAVDYGRTPFWLLSNWQQSYLQILISIGIAAALLKKKFRELFLIPFLIFALMLLPVSGLVGFLFQNISTVSDRYMYLPLIGLSLGFATWASNTDSVFILKRHFSIQNTLKLASILIISTFFILSFFRVDIFKDNKIFFNTMLKQNSNSSTAYTNLGAIYFQEGDTQLAAAYLTKAYQISPEIFANFANYFILQQRLGNHDLVISLADEKYSAKLTEGRIYQKLIWRNLLNSIAASLYDKGNFPASLSYLCQIIRELPSDILTLQNFYKVQSILIKNKSSATCAP